MPAGLGFEVSYLNLTDLCHFIELSKFSAWYMVFSKCPVVETAGPVKKIVLKVYNGVFVLVIIFHCSNNSFEGPITGCALLAAIGADSMGDRPHGQKVVGAMPPESPPQEFC